MKIPRIDILTHKVCHGRQAERNFMRTGIAYAEEYVVQVMRPDRPMRQKSYSSFGQANLSLQKEKETLKREGYAEVLVMGRVMKL